jgi:hypothetical protein
VPLILRAPPQEVYEALDTGLRALASSPMIAAHLPQAARALAHREITKSALRLALGPPPQLSLRSFVLDLDGLAELDLSAVRPSGWHHLLATGLARTTVLARTALRGDEHTFAALSESPCADDLQNRMLALAANPRISLDSFEAFLLEVPALHVLAVWLKSATPVHDLLVPLARAFPPLIAGQQYSAAEFLGVLCPLARAKLQTDDPRRGR